MGRKRTTIYLDENLLKEAKNRELNLSKIARDALREVLEEHAPTQKPDKRPHSPHTPTDPLDDPDFHKKSAKALVSWGIGEKINL